MAAAMLDAYAPGLGDNWLGRARRLIDWTLDAFSLDDGPALAEIQPGWPEEPPLSPTVNWLDDELPCANAVLTGTLEKLAAATGVEDYAERAAAIAQACPWDSAEAGLLAPAWLTLTAKEPAVATRRPGVATALI
jgi:uncharacterized protein YyaL (SSP411 family)